MEEESLNCLKLGRRAIGGLGNKPPGNNATDDMREFYSAE